MLQVLAADLFRIRIVPDETRTEQPSWAVSKHDWPAVSCLIKARRETVSLETAAGRLTLGMRNGGWRLTDASNCERFVAIPGTTGFVGERAQLRLKLTEGESLFGLGETTGTFNKRGLIREFWNIDVLGHAPAIHPSLRNLYASIPFGISIRYGIATALFWDNPARQIWDLGQTDPDQWRLEAFSDEINLYLFLGPTVKELVSRYTELTGRLPLPPRWSLGYQQCRYSYESRARLEAVARKFRRKRIPCDVLYLDIHHMNGYRVFTFGKTFPRVTEMIARLARQGFKVVTIVDPGVKDDRRFGVLRRGLSQGSFVRTADGKNDYIGKVWPGQARFPDFTRRQVRLWWGIEQARLLKIGVAGFWNDMNEPANFALPSKTLPEDCLHLSDCGPIRHAQAHNIYGMQMARASHEGALAAFPDRRPFIITRAGYSGVQRYALMWTGDNSSVWEHLGDSVQMLMNLGLSGMAFCGSDAGGFLENATGELLARWMQTAALTPFFRNHSNLGTIDQEPWAFGPKVEAICRRYIELRYRLLPYLYGLFLEAHREGAPIVRPLSWHYQDDPVAVATGDQFMVGPELLAAPVLRQGATARSVYLPNGVWFDFWTGARHAGGRSILATAPLETLPLFVRAGAIVPMGPVQQFIQQRKENGRVDLHVWVGGNGTCLWYEDDGVSQGYLSGQFHERRLDFATQARGARLQLGRAGGKLTSQVKRWRVVVHGLHRRYRGALNRGSLGSNFDRAAGSANFEFENSRSAIELRLLP